MEGYQSNFKRGSGSSRSSLINRPITKIEKIILGGYLFRQSVSMREFGEKVGMKSSSSISFMAGHAALKLLYQNREKIGLEKFLMGKEVNDNAEK